MKYRSDEAVIPPVSLASARQAVLRLAAANKVGLQESALFVAVFLVLAYIAFGVDIYMHQRILTVRQETRDFDESLVLGGALACTLLVFAVRWFREQKREIARRIEAEATAWKLAHTDALTGLANRRHFEEMLSSALPTASDCSPAAVLILDLNGFKQINDIHGHATGDAVLKVVARRLERVVRPSDLVARLGGDEFVVLASCLDNPSEAGDIAARTIAALREPVAVDGQHFDVGTGIGIALLPNDASDTGEAVRRADVALYRAKCSSRSAFCYFAPEMDQSLRQQLRVEHELRAAIEADRVDVRFLPSVNAETGEVEGYKALPFWSPEGGRELSPEQLVSLAEESRLTDAFAGLVWERAFRAASRWQDELRLSIPIRPSQLKEGELHRLVLLILEKTRFDPRRLDIELDETVMAEEAGSLKAFLRPLQEVGIRITLAGFGGETTRLQCLKPLKIGALRINRRISSCPDGPERDSLIRALTKFGHEMGFAVSMDAISASSNPVLEPNQAGVGGKA
jgi:diguanylate cyclase (GGDEF)-like protein